MALFRKKADPISARSRALNAEISALELEIRRLHSRLEEVRSPGSGPSPAPAASVPAFAPGASPSAAPRVRSTALPPGAVPSSSPSPAHPSAPVPSPPSSHPPRESVFESLDFHSPKNRLELESSAQHYNDLGVRKYDLLGAFRRLRHFFRAAPATNPRLVSYLAAGSIKGLRPLRYEKRVARNRFLFLFGVFVLVLWGIAAAIFRQR